MSTLEHFFSTSEHVCKHTRKLGFYSNGEGLKSNHLLNIHLWNILAKNISKNISAENISKNILAKNISKNILAKNILAENISKNISAENISKNISAKNILTASGLKIFCQVVEKYLAGKVEK